MDETYGYLLVHFIEDPEHYAERIYLDLSEVTQHATPSFIEPPRRAIPWSIL